MRVNRDFNHIYSLTGQISKAPKIGVYLINATMLMFGVRAASVFRRAVLCSHSLSPQPGRRSSMVVRVKGQLISCIHFHLKHLKYSGKIPLPLLILIRTVPPLIFIISFPRCYSCSSHLHAVFLLQYITLRCTSISFYIITYWKNSIFTSVWWVLTDTLLPCVDIAGNSSACKTEECRIKNKC